MRDFGYYVLAGEVALLMHELCKKLKWKLGAREWWQAY